MPRSTLETPQRRSRRNKGRQSISSIPLPTADSCDIPPELGFDSTPDEKTSIFSPLTPSPGAITDEPTFCPESPTPLPKAVRGVRKGLLDARSAGNAIEKTTKGSQVPEISSSDPSYLSQSNLHPGKFDKTPSKGTNTPVSVAEEKIDPDSNLDSTLWSGTSHTPLQFAVRTRSQESAQASEVGDVSTPQATISLTSDREPELSNVPDDAVNLIHPDKNEDGEDGDSEDSSEGEDGHPDQDIEDFEDSQDAQNGEERGDNEQNQSTGPPAGQLQYFLPKDTSFDASTIELAARVPTASKSNQDKETPGTEKIVEPTPGPIFSPYIWAKESQDLPPEEIVRQLVQQRVTPTDFNEENSATVYVFRLVTDPRYVKVGRSKTVKTRSGAIMWECGLELEVVATEPGLEPVKVRNPNRVEKLVHAELKNFRRAMKCGGSVCKTINHGEWFEVSASHAQAVVAKFSTWMKDKQPYDENLKYRLIIKEDDVLKQVVAYVGAPLSSLLSSGVVNPHAGLETPIAQQGPASTMSNRTIQPGSSKKPLEQDKPQAAAQERAYPHSRGKSPAVSKGKASTPVPKARKPLAIVKSKSPPLIEAVYDYVSDVDMGGMDPDPTANDLSPVLALTGSPLFAGLVGGALWSLIELVWRLALSGLWGSSHGKHSACS